METAASFEVRNAPSSYPTEAGNGGHRQGDPQRADRCFRYSAAISASTSNFTAVRSGATPSAIVKAIMPSILPVERRLLNFLLPAASRSMTQLLAQNFNTGWS